MFGLKLQPCTCLFGHAALGQRSMRAWQQMPHLHPAWVHINLPQTIFSRTWMVNRAQARHARVHAHHMNRTLESAGPGSRPLVWKHPQTLLQVQIWTENQYMCWILTVGAQFSDSGSFKALQARLNSVFRSLPTAAVIRSSLCCRFYFTWILWWFAAVIFILWRVHFIVFNHSFMWVVTVLCAAARLGRDSLAKEVFNLNKGSIMVKYKI